MKNITPEGHTPHLRGFTPVCSSPTRDTPAHPRARGASPGLIKAKTPIRKTTPPMRGFTTFADAILTDQDVHPAGAGISPGIQPA